MPALRSPRAACSPQVFPDVASEVAAVLKPGALIVSMMAGVSSSTIRDALEGADVSAVVRTMVRFSASTTPADRHLAW